MKINYFAIATIATIVGSSLVAQSTSPQTRTVPAQVRQDQTVSVDLQTKDQTFAKCLTITNQEQVLMARFAKDLATNPEVKDFAATLEKEHQSCVEKLNGLSSQLGGNRKAPTSSNASTTTFTKSDKNSNLPSVDFLQLHQEMADQCLEDSKAMLNKKEGIEIDKCFVGMQIAKHAGMHSSLTVLQRHATGELQGIITQGLETNAQHMEAAIKLMEQLAKIDSTKLSRDSR
jgi:predicted outer membrane protein